ncbi:MAG TPA: tetratricopeptide repeat protein [Verrucomicrobiae bacterium]
MKIVALLLAFCLAFPVDACVWVKGTTKEGKATRVSGFGPARHLEWEFRNSIKTDLAVEGRALVDGHRTATSVYDRNDYAVGLMYLGRAAEAVTYLEKIEAELPGDYHVAANLGTALELSGRNTEAKKWIEEGIRRNPDSHFGTEWLHVAILDAKIKQDSDPQYFNHHSVLNIDYQTLQTGAKEIPLLGQKRDLRELTKALRYQLTERLKFVKGKDPVVASLLFDYAAIEAGTSTLESAIGLLKLAAEYGYPSSRIEPLLASYSRTIQIATWKTRLYIASGIAAFIALIAYAIRRRWIFVKRPTQPTASPAPLAT